MGFGLGFVVVAVRSVRPREDRTDCVALAAVFKLCCIRGEIVGNCTVYNRSEWWWLKAPLALLENGAGLSVVRALDCSLWTLKGACIYRYTCKLGRFH